MEDLSKIQLKNLKELNLGNNISNLKLFSTKKELIKKNKELQMNDNCLSDIKILETFKFEKLETLVLSGNIKIKTEFESFKNIRMFWNGIMKKLKELIICLEISNIYHNY